MFSVATFDLIIFGRLPNLTLIWTTAFLRVLFERETRDTGIVYSEGDNMFTMKSWNWWKAWDKFCWRQNLRLAILFMFPFLPLLFLFCSHPPTVFCYFNTGEVHSWSKIRVIPVEDITYIILQSRLILLQYLHIFFLNLLNWYYGSFPHSVVHWLFEEKIPRWLLNNLCSEENNRIICPYFFYLYRCKSTVWYPIYALSFILRRDICLGIGGKFGSAEGKIFVLKICTSHASNNIEFMWQGKNVLIP